MKNDLMIVRRWIKFFMVVLFLSGLTAIPAESGLAFLSRCFDHGSTIDNWIENVYVAVMNTNRQYPFLAYGYDWLAFAHFVLAILFVGPLRDPVRNKWVIEFGMIACLLIIPYAMIAGHFRGIPVWWRLIDCSFGLVGLVPLAVCYSRIKEIENESTPQLAYEN